MPSESSREVKQSAIRFGIPQPSTLFAMQVRCNYSSYKTRNYIVTCHKGLENANPPERCSHSEANRNTETPRLQKDIRIVATNHWIFPAGGCWICRVHGQ
jgi:hypothetical protein